jgi:hypothetical protein
LISNYYESSSTAYKIGTGYESGGAERDTVYLTKELDPTIPLFINDNKIYCKNELSTAAHKSSWVRSPSFPHSSGTINASQMFLRIVLIRLASNESQLGLEWLTTALAAPGCLLLNLAGGGGTQDVG